MVYANLAKDWHEKKTYGDGKMQATTETFSKLENELLEKLIDKDGVENRA